LSYRLNLRSKKGLGNFTAAEAVWDDLRDRYGAPTIPQVYKDFKEAINIRINPNAHPSLQVKVEDARNAPPLHNPQTLG